MKISDTERQFLAKALGDLSPAMRFALINHEVLEAIGTGALTDRQEERGQVARAPDNRASPLMLWGGRQQYKVLMALVAENGLKFQRFPKGAARPIADIALFVPGRTDPIYIEFRHEDRPLEGPGSLEG